VKRTALLLLFCAGSFLMPAQSINPFFQKEADSTAAWEIGAFADYSACSNALTNPFINAFYTGAYITNGQKDQVAKRLSATNHLGFDINEGFFYQQHPDTFLSFKGVSWFVAVKNRSHVNSGFSKDLFNLAFYGNTGYKGQTLDAGNFNLNTIQYQQMQAGFTYNWFIQDWQRSLLFGASLSVYNGQAFENLQVPSAKIYTSATGDYLDLSVAYKRMLSDQQHSNPGSSNGIGAGLDLFILYPIVLDARHRQIGNLRIELSDLGFIRWNSKTSYYRGDTAFHFDGFPVKNAFQLGDTSIHYSTQSLLHVRPDKQAAFTSYLPAMIDIKYIPMGIHYQFIWGLRYRHDPGYVLYEYLQFCYHFGMRYSLAAEIGLGGYGGGSGNLQSGLFVKALLPGGFNLKAGTNNVFGYLMPSNTSGEGVFVSLVKVFH
jgi:hypothetical protein